MIDFNGLAEEIFNSAVGALGQGSLLVQARARHLAPVRHIFAGDSYTIRYKKASEIEADRSVRAQLGLSVEGSLDNPHPRTIRSKSPLRRTDPGNRWAGTYGSRPKPNWRERRLQVAQQHLADYDEEMGRRRAGGEPDGTLLDRRGAYEVRSMRAKSARWGQAFIGGRLRDSIRVMGPPAVSGWVATSWVVAGNDEVDYAKYMEFGTRHAAAHPFLRPALAESKEEIVGRIAAAIKEAARTSGTSVDLEIQVRL